MPNQFHSTHWTPEHDKPQATPHQSEQSAIDLARRFHTLYEALAPNFGYETRKESAKPWSQVPEQNKNLMIAVCEQILKELAPKEPTAPTNKLQLLASAMRKTLPPALLQELIDHCDPFAAFMREMVEPTAPTEEKP